MKIGPALLPKEAFHQDGLLFHHFLLCLAGPTGTCLSQCCVTSCQMAIEGAVNLSWQRAVAICLSGCHPHWVKGHYQNYSHSVTAAASLHYITLTLVTQHKWDLKGDCPPSMRGHPSPTHPTRMWHHIRSTSSVPFCAQDLPSVFLPQVWAVTHETPVEMPSN